MVTIHNINREKANRPGEVPLMEQTARSKSFTVLLKGESSITFDKAQEIWVKVLKDLGLEYKRFESEDPNNWIGTMSPYLCYSSAFNLRMKELRMGHGRIITGKTDNGRPKGTPVQSLGGYHTYDIACTMEWTMAGEMEDTQASQIVFHSLFGTYGEDLSILEQCTNVRTWYTRNQLGGCFRNSASGKSVKFKLPKFRFYLKLG